MKRDMIASVARLLGEVDVDKLAYLGKLGTQDLAKLRLSITLSNGSIRAYTLNTARCPKRVSGEAHEFHTGVGFTTETGSERVRECKHCHVREAT